MNRTAYIRIFLLALIASISLILFSYSHKIPATGLENTDCNGMKSEPKKAQSEFIIWESLSRNLLSANR
jgi:hypothetical protein